MPRFEKEHFGAEAPGPGWHWDGAGRWTRQGPRVAVVGGGPGGLYATYILSRRYPDAAVTLFEASDRFGGKMRTDEFSDGSPFEAGVAELYEYKGPGGGDPMRMLIEEDLGLHTANMSGGGVVVRGKLVRKMEDLKEEFGYGTFKRVQAFHRRMAELMPLEKYALRWQPDNSHPWADKKFHECIREEIPDDDAAVAYVEAAVHSDLATEPWTCNGLNGIKNVLMDNDEYMQLYHVTGGIERIARALVADLSIDVDFRMEHRVTSVAREKDAYRVSWREGAEEGSALFDAVVLAVPNHWLTQIRWGAPKLTDAFQRMLAHYDLPAHYFRVSYRFSENWWEGHRIPGEFWMMDLYSGCCCYNEAARWRQGNVLSFLLGGQDALLQVSANQEDEEIAHALLEALPGWMRDDALETVVEYQIDSYAGAINAQPGGWPAEELRGEHQPDPEDHPGVFVVGDYLFDSTLNAALISAYTAVDLLLEHFGQEGLPGTHALEQLDSRGAELSLW